MTFKSFDIVIVPFPFVESKLTKIRPALVLSNEKFNKNGSIILSMITSAKHVKKSGDIVITNLKSANLSFASIVRVKLFTVDLSVIHKKIGVLDKVDQSTLKENFKNIFLDLFAS